jgi:hypothetical protein
LIHFDDELLTSFTSWAIEQVRDKANSVWM